MKNKRGVFTALDIEKKEEILYLVKNLVNISPYFKIGLRAFVRYGPSLIKEVQDRGGIVFLDLKLFDIPHTVETAIKSMNHLGIFMTTVHIQGGREMLKSAMRANSENEREQKIKLMGVTVLTSWSNEDLKGVWRDGDLEKHISHLADLAQEEKLDGIVCSALEVGKLKKRGELLALTPGIRINMANTQDQKRVVNPQTAKINGSDFIVVGREVINAKSPEFVLEKIVSDFI